MKCNLKTIYLSEEEKELLLNLLRLNENKSTLNITSAIYLILKEVETVEKLNRILYILDNLKITQKRVLRTLDDYLQSAIVINEARRYKFILPTRELINASTRLRELKFTNSRVSTILNKYKEFHSEP